MTLCVLCEIIAGRVPADIVYAGDHAVMPHLHAHVVPRRRKDGLRGFFWPRVRYSDDAERAQYAARLRERLRDE